MYQKAFGVKMRSVSKELVTILSSNVSSMVLPLKPVVPSAGIDFNSIGGVSSSGPPVGVPTLAQDARSAKGRRYTIR